MVLGMTISLSRRQVLTTVDQLRASEAVLAVRADELDMVMSHLDDGVAIIEEGGRVLHANQALLTAFGTREPEPLEHVAAPGEEKGQAYHPDGRPLKDADNPLYRAMAGEVVEREEIHHTDEYGVFRVLECSAFQVPHAEGTPKRVMIVLRDITAASSYRESLVGFAGTVAHDLNNPLSVIDGWAEALEDRLSESDQSDAAAAAPMVQHIRVGVDQMRGFISDLLAHAVARDQSLKCEPVSLTNLVKHIVATRDRPQGGGEIVAGDLVDVWADRVLVRQVLDNLIGNAFKYVAEGTVPRVLVEAQPIEHGMARVQVRDNGIGVSPDQRDQIFEDFHRATAEGYQGTGLGLAICRRIVQRHGGNISVTGNPDGVGSAFEFTLPMTPEAFTAANT
jgi:signal transduction histidine kinase